MNQFLRARNQNSIFQITVLVGLLASIIGAAPFFFPGLEGIPSAAFLNWDAAWYKSIADQGYVFIPNAQNNLAFFPLFPFMWKILGLSGLYISVVNAAIFILGLTILSNSFRLESWETAAFISIPGLFFCALPYSEALFYFFSAIFLWSLTRNKLHVSGVSLYCACLTRTAGLLFLGSILFNFFFQSVICRKNIKEQIRISTVLSLSVIISLVTVALIQFSQTGHWFYFFEVQKYWNTYPRIPSFPLTTQGGTKVLWADGFGFIAGLLSFISLIWISIQRLLKEKNEIHSAFIFSISYLAIVTISIVFTHPIIDGNTDIFALHRYTLATPFFPISLLFYRIVPGGKRAILPLLGIGIPLGLLLLNSSFFEPSTFLIILGLSLSYFVGVIFKVEFILGFACCFGLFSNLLLMYWFLRGDWVG